VAYSVERNRTTSHVYLTSEFLPPTRLKFDGPSFWSRIGDGYFKPLSPKTKKREHFVRAVAAFRR
jgi:hypothetical protein